MRELHSLVRAHNRLRDREPEGNRYVTLQDLLGWR
jgi:hypothetical protein